MTVDDIIALIVPLTPSSARVGAHTPVLSTGLLDSYRFAAFVEALRSKAGVDIDVGDVGVDNFDTPAQILAFLGDRQ